MSARQIASQNVLLNAEIIFAELYFHIHGHACQSDIWPAAIAAWKAGSQIMPMIEAAICAAVAIEAGVVRRPAVN